MKPTSIERWRPGQTGVVVGLILLGITVRLWALLCGRSFWCDEAMLAMNITGRGFLGLLRPLDWNQAAPVGFLLAERSVMLVFGRSEIALRLIPFFSGVGSLILGAILARRYLGPRAGVTAVILLACSDTLVYYSNELKQYESDAFIFILFVRAMLHVHESNWNRRSTQALTIIGAAGVWSSHIVVFGMGGFFLGMCFLNGPREMGARCKRACIIALVWSAAFGLNYFFFLRAVTHNAFLQNYWRGGYLPARLLSIESAQWVLSTIYASVAHAVGENSGQLLAGLLLVCVVVGMAQFWRTQRALAMFLWFPMLLAFFAAIIHEFPFEGRLITFLIPGTLLTAAGAIDALPSAGLAAIDWRWALAAGLGVLPLVSVVDRLRGPDHRQELRTVLRAIKPDVRDGDTLYVYSQAWAAYAYYHNILNEPALHVVCGVDLRDDYGAYVRDVDRLRGRGRVWFIGTNFIASDGPIREDFLTVPFLERGRQIERSSAFGAVAILYEM